ETVEPAWIDAEGVGSMRELLAAARDVGAPALDRKLCAFVDLCAGLVVAGDEPGHHERLRLGPRLGQAALDEQHVEPLLHDSEPMAGRGAAAAQAVRTASESTISRSTLVSASTSPSRARARSAA